MNRDLSRSRAILIGNSTYRPDSGIPNLPAASMCVAAMTKLLTSNLCGWPEDRIQPLVDITAPHELARKIARAVKDVQRVVLLYYVGHGLRTPKGQLALALGDSDSDPSVVSHTTILYENIADILRGCPADTKLVMLDCCHAELGNKANYVFQSTDLAEAYPVDGLYFIGASKTHEKAKTPLAGSLTYFTQNLIATVEQGIPNRPEFLALDQIFVALRSRMMRQGLPEPVESGTRGARQFPFARNAADRTDLERRYTLARAAEDSGDWTAAIRGYDEILKIDPAYRDAAARPDLCRQRDQVARLQSELEDYAAAGDWPQVLTTIKKLTGLDPAAAAKPSYTDLAARARLELTAHPPEPLRRIDCSSEVHVLSWHPGGIRIAVGNNSSTAARVYDISGKEHKEQLVVNKPVARWLTRAWDLRDVAFSPDGTRLATASDKAARVWETASGRKLLTVRHEEKAVTVSNSLKFIATGADPGTATEVLAVAFSPDGTRLATGSRDTSARVWDAASGQQLLKLRHNDAVWAVAFSPDGTRLATGSSDTSACVWDAASGQQLLYLPHGNIVWALAFSPDGTRLATGSFDHNARVWDAASGRQLLELSRDIPVMAVAFSPDGTRLATGGWTGTVWDAASGRKLLDLRHDKAVWAVAFSPDGTRLATGSLDKSVRIWPVAEL